MYVKLYQDILTSTVWMQPDHVLRVWLTMLLLANSEGYVRISIPGLAKEAGVDVLKARDALATLEAPDEDSQSKENEGRRVIRLDEAEPVWFIVNYVKYRTLKNAEAKKGYMREYMRAYRARRKPEGLTSKGDVSLIPPCKSQGEGDGEGDGDGDGESYSLSEGESREGTVTPSQPSPSAPERKKREKKILQSYKADAGFMAIWEAYPAARRVGALKAFEALVNARKRPDYPGDAAVLESLRTLVEEDWRFREPKFIKHPSTWLNSDGWEDVPAGPSWEERRRQAKERMVSGHQGPIDPLLGG